jgi:hypothetical protein
MQKRTPHLLRGAEIFYIKQNRVMILRFQVLTAVNVCQLRLCSME